MYQHTMYHMLLGNVEEKEAQSNWIRVSQRVIFIDWKDMKKRFLQKRNQNWKNTTTAFLYLRLRFYTYIF